MRCRRSWRARLYKDKVSADSSITGKTRIADAFGVSNSAKVIEKGLFAFNANFNAIARDIDQVVANCLLRFPPEDEIYFSLFLKSEIDTFRARPEEMRGAGSSRPRRRSMAEDEGDEGADDDETAEAPETEPPAASLHRLEYTNNNKNVGAAIIAAPGCLPVTPYHGR
jgi:5-methylcytosine-specific restriction enzyme B